MDAGDKANDKVAALDKQIARYHLRGQWQSARDPLRPQRIQRDNQNRVLMEPSTSGVPHCWKWNDISEFMRLALEHLDQSTVVRALIMTNPGLQRGTTHTLAAAYQVVAPGEIAWAHRHSINALRIGIEGSADVFTVVDGVAVPMEPYDVVLTPGWRWHEHHNKTDKPACWLDCLDVPFTLALNQSFYEDLGDATQERVADEDVLSEMMLRPVGSTDPASKAIRYPWKKTWEGLQRVAREGVSPHDGAALDLVDPITRGSVLPTINVSAHLLPPGYRGKPVRRSASSISFVIQGEGTTVVDDAEISWQRHDTLVIPNWTWQRIINRSSSEPAVLFTLSDAPILHKFGLFRQQTAPD